MTRHAKMPKLRQEKAQCKETKQTSAPQILELPDTELFN